MSKFGDKIKSVFTMDYNDEYDDDYYDDIDDEIEEEIDHPTPSRRSAAKTERHEEEEAPRSTTHEAEPLNPQEVPEVQETVRLYL